MGVEVIGLGQETDGYGDSMDAFRSAHEANTKVLLNLSEGAKKNAPRAAYDPDHPDNAWPVMVYSADNKSGSLQSQMPGAFEVHDGGKAVTVGRNLKGLIDPQRAAQEKQNKRALELATKVGYRTEPYPKPQVAVLDPAAEKAALMAKNDQLQGMIVSQQDLLNKMQEKLEQLAAKVA